MLPLCKKHVVGLRWKTTDWFLYNGKIAIKVMSLMWPPAAYASSKPALEMIILLNTCKVNPVFPNFPFDPPKTSENLWFSDVFRGIKREHWEEMG